VEAMDRLGISYVAWNLSNKEETSAILSGKCSKTSDFIENDLSASGKWLYRMLTDKS
jgi:endoglucanase